MSVHLLPDIQLIFVIDLQILEVISHTLNDFGSLLICSVGRWKKENGLFWMKQVDLSWKRSLNENIPFI